MKEKADLINKQLSEVNKGLQTPVEGNLKVFKRGSVFHYALQSVDHDSNKYCSRYLGKKDINLVRKIVSRDYCVKLLKLLKRQQKAINILTSTNYDELIDECYSRLHEGRKQLINPLPGTAQYKISAWYAEEYEQNQSYPEGLIYETERGELVRSKSEAMIADYLYSKRDYIDYKYERPLVLRVNGVEETIHPDFTIINLKTGKMYILEHVSRLDLPHYHDKFVWKHKAFIENGLVQKGMVLYSFESEGQPFTIKLVKKMVQDIIIG